MEQLEETVPLDSLVVWRNLVYTALRLQAKALKVSRLVRLSPGFLFPWLFFKMVSDDRIAYLCVLMLNHAILTEESLGKYRWVQG